MAISDNLSLDNQANLNDNYEPESKLFAYQSLKQSPNFKIKSYDYAEYRGEVVTKVENKAEIELRHGFGAMIYQSGRIYEGIRLYYRYRTMG